MEYKRLQFKALDTDTEQGVFDGHASVWDIVDSEGDVVERGAFAKTITEGIAKEGVPILALHNDTVLPVGKTLALREDDEGLYVKGYISPTSMGNDVRTLIRDGVLKELSIGYVPVAHKMEGNVRHLLEVELPEISVVTWAANSAAKITGYKGANEMRNTKQAPPIETEPPEKNIRTLLEEGNRLMAQLRALGCELPDNDPLAGKSVEEQMALLGVSPEDEEDDQLYIELDDDED